MKSKKLNLLQFVNIVRENIYINKLLKPEEEVLITISGGQDSVCLLLIFYLLQSQLTFKFDYIWCNHFWQKSSFFTMLHLTKLSYSLSSKILLVLPLRHVLSEQSARDWRYQITERTSLFHKYSVCTQGHSKTDRIETILFNLFRGSGMTGISALRWKRIQSFSYSNKFYPGFSQFVQHTHTSFFKLSEFEIALKDEKMFSQLPIYISYNKFSPKIEVQTQELLLRLLPFPLKKVSESNQLKTLKDNAIKNQSNENQLTFTNFPFFRSGTFPFQLSGVEFFRKKARPTENTSNFQKGIVKYPVPYQMQNRLKTSQNAYKSHFSYCRIKKSQLICTTCYYQLKHLTL